LIPLLSKPTKQMPRKLASIQTVTELKKHPNADTLELATILGWQIIVKIGQCMVGQPVVYFEIDSILPDAAWTPQIIRDKKFRVKTIRIRDELSQGLIIPIEEIPELAGREFAPGNDVTELLHVSKWEQDLSNVVTAAGNFPAVIDKTDEPRIQSNPELLRFANGKEYYATIKLDGSSASYFLDSAGNLVVCSRNNVRDKPQGSTDPKTCVWWHIAETYNIAEKLHRMSGVAIQGEIVGPNIQKNLLGLTRYEFYVFNVIELSTRRKLPLAEAIEALETLNGDRQPNSSSSEAVKQLRMRASPELLDRLIKMYQGALISKSTRDLTVELLQACADPQADQLINELGDRVDGGPVPLETRKSIQQLLSKLKKQTFEQICPAEYTPSEWRQIWLTQIRYGDSVLPDLFDILANQLDCSEVNIATSGLVPAPLEPRGPGMPGLVIKTGQPWTREREQKLASEYDSVIYPFYRRTNIVFPTATEFLSLACFEAGGDVYTPIDGPATLDQAGEDRTIATTESKPQNATKLQLVPIDSRGIFNFTVPQLLQMAKGKYPGTNNHREGLVFRTLDQRVSFKAINNDYVLKNDL
jgi:RNA ligase (TIGR02306 family)